MRSPVLATTADDGLTEGEYDTGAVKKLILARRMAPFYEGRGEAAQMARAPDSPELSATDNTRSLSASPPPVATRRKHGFFRTRRKTDLADLPAVTELLGKVDTECPICFLVCTFLSGFRKLTVVLVFSQKYQLHGMLWTGPVFGLLPESTEAVLWSDHQLSFLQSP